METGGYVSDPGGRCVLYGELVLMELSEKLEWDGIQTQHSTAQYALRSRTAARVCSHKISL